MSIRPEEKPPVVRSLGLRFGLLAALIVLVGSAGVAGAVRDGSDEIVGAVIAALVVAAVVTALTITVRTARAVTGPLADVEAALGRLARAEHPTTRVRPRGPAEIQAIARSANAVADETDRMRDRESERARLAAAAREAGIAIRSGLDVDQILDRAATGIGQALRADGVILFLAGDDSSTAPAARAWSAKHGSLPAHEVRGLPPLPADMVHDHHARGTSWYVDDVRRFVADGEPVPGAPGSFGRTGLPARLRDTLAAMRAVSVLAVAFGPPGKPMGEVVLVRETPGDVWRPAEIEATEPIVAGLGRALQQARVHRQETAVVERLRALDKTRNDFLSNVSHELRTPLTSIGGYVELLQDESGPLSDDQRHMLTVVGRNVVRLTELIEDLLTISRIESGSFTSDRRPVDVRRLAEVAVDMATPAASAAAITLEGDCGEEPVLVLGDHDQLDRALRNLVSNAIKFTPSGGKVTVGAALHRGQVRLRVSDTGIGIPENDQKDLFNRFFRASNAVDLSIPGTGLGLAIVHAIVANHGGTLEVHSRENEGTTITADLPPLDRRS
ncbi:HAMP domain-containing protein [Streptomyces kaniharaensis]|uniref:histidine kinase n=1 Tax=Streptomyces kaniharaensis TaxID=212423 RepID=A0A6N7KVH0_9ACTN|nr:ATP-binding protein [Streptomyces kaniharaensis]MQS15451.1 HAMP domain-containing protein [Streptomyces kaniharaensis]